MLNTLNKKFTQGTVCHVCSNSRCNGLPRHSGINAAFYCIKILPVLQCCHLTAHHQSYGLVWIFKHIHAHIYCNTHNKQTKQNSNE